MKSDLLYPLSTHIELKRSPSFYAKAITLLILLPFIYFMLYPLFPSRNVDVGTTNGQSHSVQTLQRRSLEAPCRQVGESRFDCTDERTKEKLQSLKEGLKLNP